MAYADYKFYTDTYKGSAIAASEFERLVLRASSYIDQITGGRASSYSPADPVKMAVCAAAEAWQTNEQGGEVVNEAIGSWSRTFAANGRSKAALLYDAAELYLGRTGLMSRWL